MFAILSWGEGEIVYFTACDDTFLYFDQTGALIFDLSAFYVLDSLYLFKNSLDYAQYNCKLINANFETRHNLCAKYV